jgi:hypothetical protein
VSPLDKLGEIQAALDEVRNALLREWRVCGKTDDAILRDKLIECGWRYRRTSGGGWYHPLRPEVTAPKTLADLAYTIARIKASEAME